MPLGGSSGRVVELDRRCSEARCAPDAHHGELLTVVPKRQAPHTALTGGDGFATRSRGRIPEANRTVVAARNQCLSVWAERQGADGLIEARKYAFERGLL